MEEVKQCKIEIPTLKAIQRLILLTVYQSTLLSLFELIFLLFLRIIYFYETIVCHKSCKLIKRRNVIALFAMLPLQFPDFSLHEVEFNFIECYVFMYLSRVSC